MVCEILISPITYFKNQILFTELKDFLGMKVLISTFLDNDEMVINLGRDKVLIGVSKTILLGKE